MQSCDVTEASICTAGMDTVAPFPLELARGGGGGGGEGIVWGCTAGVRRGSEGIRALAITE